MNVSVELSPPSAQVFVALRTVCGWGDISVGVAEAALRSSIVNVTWQSESGLIGMGRVVGDGVLYFYLQDIIVLPEWRGQGIGRLIIEALLTEAKKIAPEGATHGLMAAHDKVAFYEKFGFEQRPTNRLGAEMTQFIL